MHDVLRRLALSLLLPSILLSLGLVVADAAAQGDQSRHDSPSAFSVAANIPGKLVIAVPSGTDLGASESSIGAQRR